MVPALATAALSSVFLVVSMVGWSDDKANIKNAYWMSYEQVESDEKREIFEGLNTQVVFVNDEFSGEREMFPEEWTVEDCKAECAEEDGDEEDREEGDRDGEDRDGEDRDGEDRVRRLKKLNLRKSASARSAKSGAEKRRVEQPKEECEKECDDRQMDSVASKLCFSCAVIAFIMSLFASLFSGLRLNEAMNCNPALRFGGVVTSFVAWIFVMIGWTFYVAEPFAHKQEQYKVCEDIDGLECGVYLGPGSIMMIVSWIMLIPTIVCHVICATKPKVSLPA